MLFSVLGALTGLGGAIRDITSSITNLQIARVKAGTDAEKAALDAQIAEAHDRRAVLIAEAGSRINAIMRGLMAMPTVILLWKIEVYDKALGQWTGGHTDALGSDLWTVITAIIAFYFVYDITARFRK